MRVCLHACVCVCVRGCELRECVCRRVAGSLHLRVRAVCAIKVRGACAHVRARELVRVRRYLVLVPKESRRLRACARGYHPVSTRKYTPPPPDSPKVPLSSIEYPPSTPPSTPLTSCLVPVDLLWGVRSAYRVALDRRNNPSSTPRVPREYAPTAASEHPSRAPIVCNRAASYPTETAPKCGRWGPVEVAVEQVPLQYPYSSPSAPQLPRSTPTYPLEYPLRTPGVITGVPLHDPHGPNSTAQNSATEPQSTHDFPTEYISSTPAAPS